MFWHEVDGALLRESAKFAGHVRDSIRASVNVDDIIRQWNLSYPKGATVTKAEAKAWAKVNIAVDNRELNKGLGILFAIGWIFGRDVATAAYANAKLDKAAPTDDALRALLNFDWSTWTPGNNPGALLASPPNGLKGLLQRRGLDLQGLSNTLLNRIGLHLSDALMSGASDTMLGAVLESLIGDPERALTIANTSMASAMSVATRETYQEFDVARMRWLALEPCSTCSGNASLGAVIPGEAAFRNVEGAGITEPPAHPNCRCALAPVIDLGNGLTMAVEADLTKYDPNQPRDAKGRFGSGGASASTKPVSHIDRLQESQIGNAGFKDGITEAETKALVKYKENDFSPINMMLRKGGIPAELPSMQTNVDNLDALIEKAPPVGETFTVHRVVLGTSFTYSLENLQKGWSFKDPAFMSTTLDKSHAESRIRLANDSEQSSLMLNIIVQKGQKGLFVEPLIKGKSKISILHEEEFLLPRNTVLTKIGNNSDGSIDVVAELG